MPARTARVDGKFATLRNLFLRRRGATLAAMLLSAACGSPRSSGTAPGASSGLGGASGVISSGGGGLASAPGGHAGADTGGAGNSGGTAVGGGAVTSGAAGTSSGGQGAASGGTSGVSGATGTGGAAGATGSGGAAGAIGSGGTAGAAGGSAGTTGIRGLTPGQIVKDMGSGWNLGNTFDATPNETSWGNPPTTQAMVQAVKAAGFKTIRVPVTWTDHIGSAPNYTIDAAWMGKVEQVVKWVLDAGMYAIVNTHHDADEQWILLTSAAQAQVTGEVTAVWKQIATRFKDYSDYLIFETFNEPHGPVNQYSGGNAEQQAVLNAYIAAALAAIRGTGGNNAARMVMIQPHGASPVEAGVRALTIPADPNIVISIHTYYPTAFSFGPSPTTWGTAAGDYTAMGASLDQISSWLPNRAIVIGEWGTVSGGQLDSRVRHAKAYAQDVVRRGMCPIWWDNGGSDFGILDRKANPPTWTYPTIVSALIDGAKTGATPGAVDATGP